MPVVASKSVPSLAECVLTCHEFSPVPVMGALEPTDDAATGSHVVEGLDA